MDDEPEPNRRAIIGALAFLPVIGGAAELVARAARHASHRPGRIEAAKLAPRSLMDDEQRIPVDTIADAAAESRDD